MKTIRLIGAPVTGQTRLYSSMVQDWARQYWDDSSIECYCLDAPDCVPTGRVRYVMGYGQELPASRRYDDW